MSFFLQPFSILQAGNAAEAQAKAQAQIAEFNAQVARNNAIAARQAAAAEATDIGS